MPNDNLHNMQVAQHSGGRAYYPWPQPWREPWPGQPWPHTRIYPTTTIVTAPPEDYANEVEVERREFDAVLRFYRTRENSKALVKEITVPIGLFDWLTAEG